MGPSKTGTAYPTKGLRMQQLSQPHSSFDTARRSWIHTLALASLRSPLSKAQRQRLIPSNSRWAQPDASVKRMVGLVLKQAGSELTRDLSMGWHMEVSLICRSR